MPSERTTAEGPAKGGRARKEAAPPRYPEFAARLAEARRVAGMTQEQLAATAGVPQGRVSLWETGQALPKLDQVSRMLAALQNHSPLLSLESLLEGTGMVAPGIARTPNAVLTRDELALLDLAREVGLPVARRRILGVELQPQA